MRKYNFKNLRIKQKEFYLCIGGGGANGFSAVPIINELLDQKIKIVGISGCSIGAIIGAYLAKYGEINTLCEKFMDKSKIEWMKLLDVSNPFKHLIKGKKIKAFLYELFEDSTFDELDIELTIVATNISTKKSVYFTKGKLIDAIMASISVPGIFSPYKIEDEYYFDGMLSENLPISPLLEQSRNIIAIDFFYNETLTKEIPTTLINSLVLSYTLMLTQRSRELKTNKNVFLFTPKKSGNFAMIEFYNAKKIYQLGVEELENKKEDFRRWIKF